MDFSVNGLANSGLNFISYGRHRTYQGAFYIWQVCFVAVRENAQSEVCYKYQKWVHLCKQKKLCSLS